MKNNNGSDFEVLGFSDNKYENLTVLINFREEPIAQINVDAGRDNMEIEILAESTEEFSVKFPLSKFIDVLKDAEDFLRS